MDIGSIGVHEEIKEGEAGGTKLFVGHGNCPLYGHKTLVHLFFP